jgi:hypothetical protein
LERFTPTERLGFFTMDQFLKGIPFFITVPQGTILLVLIPNIFGSEIIWIILGIWSAK